MDNKSLIDSAWFIAENAHLHQMYGEEPYINHVKRVYERTDRLAENWDDEIRLMAILHDVLEDSDVSYEELKECFGQFVASGVRTLTHREGDSYFRYLENVNKFQTAKTVKICDLMDNLKHSYLSNDEYKINKYEKALAWLATH